jgi:chromate reductase
MSVLAICGSIRAQSWNKKLLALAAAQLIEAGVDVDVFDLKAANFQQYDADIEATGLPAAVIDLKARIAKAEGLLLVSPEYNYSIPGLLKNAIDWATRPPATNPFKGKLVAQMGATTGQGGTLLAQAAIRHIMVGCMAWSLPGMFVVSKADSAFDEQGQLRDAAQKEQLAKFLKRFSDELKG